MTRAAKLQPVPETTVARPDATRFRAMMLERSKGRGAATRAWALLFDLLASTKDRWPKVAEELGVKPTQLRVLLMLFSGKRLVQRDLAELLDCDASNVTMLVDQLETKGLVERRSMLGDRRAKVLTLTRDGEAMAPKMFDKLLVPPPALEALGAADLKALVALLEKVSAHAAQAQPV
ncbi:MAG: MarR family transcriptional regulator [Myxococcaceae bacterium]|nr:MarR family transcriptional regulator [Myxococcaceae bacterium]